LHVINLSSFLLVMPTAAFCAMTSTHKKIVKASYKELKVVFKGSGVNLPEIIAQLIVFDIISRRYGLLALESRTSEIENEFLKN
ncbi:flagellar motor protein MotA, partial [Campylobacter jejuni]|nr:flagellar motor protein MotA [Campylobacter jejuni]